MPRAERLRPEREQAVRRLEEVRVQITQLVIRGRTVTGWVRRLARARNFPRRRIDQGDAHLPSSARAGPPDKPSDYAEPREPGFNASANF